VAAIDLKIVADRNWCRSSSRC